jgi:beta-lactamase class A
MPKTQGALPTPDPGPVAELERSLYRTVQDIKKKHGLERLGISFHDSETTLSWAYNADSLFHAASTIKIAVLLGVYRMVARGEITTDAPVHVRNRFQSVVDGSPFMLELGAADGEVVKRQGRTMSVEALAYEMITRSSNLATNLLVDIVGVDNIQLALSELHVEGVVMKRGVSDQKAFDAGINNLVTANGILKMLRVMSEGRAFSPQVCAQMLEIMLDTRARSGIPAGLPPAAQVAHKTGNISTVHHDAGIVYLGKRRPYFLVILTQFPAQNGRGTAVADVSRDIHNNLTSLTRDVEVLTEPRGEAGQEA